MSLVLAQDEPTFEVIVQIAPQKTSQKKARPDFVQVGPLNVKFSSTWQIFVAFLASTLKVPPSNLKINSFQWKPIKPKNASFIPVTNEDGFNSLLKKLQAPKATQTIFLSMDQFTLPVSEVRVLLLVTHYTNYILMQDAAPDEPVNDDHGLEDEALERNRKRPRNNVSRFIGG